MYKKKIDVSSKCYSPAQVHLFGKVRSDHWRTIFKNSPYDDLSANVLESNKQQYQRFLDETNETTLLRWAEIYKVDNIKVWAMTRIIELECGIRNLLRNKDA